VSEVPAVSPPQKSLSLGEILIEARKLFIDHGYPEARVSLREVNRIKDYIATFSAKQGDAKARANAFWLTLGRLMEQRNGGGAKLRELILRMEIPNPREEFTNPSWDPTQTDRVRSFKECES
jgi:hypothetical protein